MDYSNLPLVAFNAPPQLSIDLKLFKDQLGQEYKVELWLGSCSSLYICFTKMNFSSIKKLEVLPCFNILFWPRDISRDHFVKIR